MRRNGKQSVINNSTNYLHPSWSQRAIIRQQLRLSGWRMGFSRSSGFAHQDVYVRCIDHDAVGYPADAHQVPADSFAGLQMTNRNSYIYMDSLPVPVPLPYRTLQLFRHFILPCI